MIARNRNLFEKRDRSVCFIGVGGWQMYKIPPANQLCFKNHWNQGDNGQFIHYVHVHESNDYTKYKEIIALSERSVFLSPGMERVRQTFVLGSGNEDCVGSYSE